jgi:hypothetical protein
MGEANLRYKVTRKAQVWTPSVNSGRLLVKLLELAGDALDHKTAKDLQALLEMHDANRLHVTKTAIELRDAKGNTTGRILLQAGKFEVVSKPGKTDKTDKQQADNITSGQVPSITPGNVSEEYKKVRQAVA